MCERLTRKEVNTTIPVTIDQRLITILQAQPDLPVTMIEKNGKIIGTITQVTDNGGWGEISLW